MKLYHGTSSINLSKIKNEGLLSPFLTDSIDIAEYYAECSCDELGGDLVILEVDVDSKFLRYDGASMDEPVMANESRRDEQWNLALESHPEWIKNNHIIIPSNEYTYSLRGVNSVFYEGTVKLFKLLE